MNERGIEREICSMDPSCCLDGEEPILASLRAQLIQNLMTA